MSDLRRRQLERGPDEVALLAHRLRTGDLSRAQAIWAARLGHPAAKALAPDEEAVDWTRFNERRDAIKGVAKAAAGRRRKRLIVAYACDAADRVLSIFEERFPGDLRPREAIELARAWSQSSAPGDAFQALRSASAASSFAHFL